MHAAPRSTSSSARRRVRGTTIIELMVVFSVMLVAVSIFYQMVLSTKRLRILNHENAVAIEAARAVVERMRNEDFEQVFALYNADPADDPAGPGTAPGHRFQVESLDPLPAAADGCVGEVELPAELVQPPPAGGGGGGAGPQIGGLVGGGLAGGGGAGGGAGAAAVPDWQVREDFVDARLGMPRDLNGDSVIDAQDHSEDYLILPVRVRMRWQGVFGERTLDLYTMVGEFRSS